MSTNRIESSQILFREELPSVADFKKLRSVIAERTGRNGWKVEENGINDERVMDSLKKSAYCVCAYDGNNIVGMIRVSGDLSMYGYLQDTIVLPEYQGREIGSKLMKMVLRKLEGLNGYLLGVCPSPEAVNFYSKFG